MAAEAPADAAMTAAEAEAYLLVIFSLSPQAQRQVQRCERVDEKATTWHLLSSGWYENFAVNDWAAYSESW